MADISILSVPSRYRHVFADSNWVSFSLPAGWRQLDVVFEDSSGKAVLGQFAPGVVLSGATAATDARLFAWSSYLGNGGSFAAFSVAAPGGVNHAVSVVVL